VVEFRLKSSQEKGYIGYDIGRERKGDIEIGNVFEKVGFVIYL
jgi:hypothetical protein